MARKQLGDGAVATLRADAPSGAGVDALRWTEACSDFATWAERLGTPALHEHASKLAEARALVGGSNP